MSQNSLTLPTTGTVSGLQMTQYANNALDTLNTLASGASAPSSPEVGQLWHDTTNNILKLRSLDNTAWIPLFYLNESAYLAAPPSVGQISSASNRIINGDVVIDQANEGASVVLSTGVAAYVTDQWDVEFTSSTASGVTGQRVTDVPAGFTNSLKVTVGTGASSVASGDFLWIYQQIEGLNVSDLGFGSANASAVSLSFWVKSSVTGTFSAVLSNSIASFNRAYIMPFTITSANTWQKITLSNIPGDVTGTYNTNTSAGLLLMINVAAGASYQDSATTWVGAGHTCTSTQTNAVLTTSGSTFQVTGVMLNAGAFCAPFEKLKISQQLENCQRYYEKSYDTGTAVATNTFNGSEVGVAGGSAFSLNSRFKVTKRVDPTVTLYSPGTGTTGKIYNTTTSADVSTSPTNIGQNGFGSGLSATVNDTYASHWTASARY